MTPCAAFGVLFLRNTNSLILKKISVVEENRSRRLYISVLKPAVSGGGGRGWSNASPPFTTTLFLSGSVDISFKDDVTVIPLLGVSFISLILSLL
jgi:hypothetical protein